MAEILVVGEETRIKYASVTKLFQTRFDIYAKQIFYICAKQIETT